jgi:REP-associated tyrosine transposase
MPRRPRNALPESGIFHITARGAGRIAIYRDDEDRSLFVLLLKRVIRRFAWTCHVYCLMTNHYHLVIEAERGAMSSGMHHLNGIHAQAFNRRHGRDGHLFASRFSAYSIESEGYLEATCRYVLNNPVRAGLCADPSDWRWSEPRYPAGGYGARLAQPSSSTLSAGVASEATYTSVMQGR